MSLPAFLDNSFGRAIVVFVLCTIAVIALMGFGNLMHAILWGPM